MVNETTLHLIICNLILIILLLLFWINMNYDNFKNEIVYKQYIRKECDPLTEVYDCSSDKKCVNFQCVPK
jgi:hypothetical protein